VLFSTYFFALKDISSSTVVVWITVVFTVCAFWSFSFQLYLLLQKFKVNVWLQCEWLHETASGYVIVIFVCMVLRNI